MPWYHGWNIVIAGLVFQAISFGIGIYCFTFWVAPWSAEFGVGRGDIMLVFFTLQVSMGLLAPFAGQAMDRLSVRALVCAGAVSLAVALVLAARATALWQLVVLYGSLVVGGTLLAGPLAAQTLTARWFGRRRGLALGISTVGTSIGGFLLPPLVTRLQSAMGWREANDVLALLVVVAVVPLVWVVVRNQPDPSERSVEFLPSPQSTNPGQAPESLNRIWTVRMVFREPVFWLTVIAFTLFAAINGGLQQNLAPYGLDQGFDAQATAWVVSVMALVMAGWKVVIGALADRLDIRWIFLFSLLILLLAMVWMSTAPAYLEFAVICAMLGVAAAAHLPLLAAIVSRHFGIASFGLVMGLLGPFTTLSAVGPVLAGMIRDSSGSYDMALLVLGCLGAPILAVMMMLRLGPPR